MKAITLARLVTGAALSALVFLANGPSARADVLDDIKAAKKLRVAIDLGLPPYGMTDDKMQPTGSDVETAKLLAKVVDVVDVESGTVRLKKKVEDADEMALDTRSTKTVRVKK